MQPRAREGRVPAVRPAHRQVALGRLLRQGRARDYNQGLVGAVQVPGRRAAGPRSEADFDPGAKYHVPATRPTCGTSSRTSTSSSSTARSARRGAQGPSAQVQHLRQPRRGRQDVGDAPDGREQTLARRDGGHLRRAPRRRERIARVLRAAARLPRRAEPGPALRLVIRGVGIPGAASDRACAAQARARSPFRSSSSRGRASSARWSASSSADSSARCCCSLGSGSPKLARMPEVRWASPRACA
jgi:hypothetical protein